MMVYHAAVSHLQAHFPAHWCSCGAWRACTSSTTSSKVSALYIFYILFIHIHPLYTLCMYVCMYIVTAVLHNTTHSILLQLQLVNRQLLTSPLLPMFPLLLLSQARSCWSSATCPHSPGFTSTTTASRVRTISHLLYITTIVLLYCICYCFILSNTVITIQKCIFNSQTAYDMPILTLSLPMICLFYYRCEGSRTSVQRECQGGLYCIYLTTVT